MPAVTVTGHKQGVHLRREIDILIAATQGVGTSAIFAALSTQAALRDDGTLTDSAGNPGYCWRPEVYERKSADPVRSRIHAVAASLGRVMGGGHPSNRSYLAFLDAIYVVTTEQDYDVTARIEKLWDDAAARGEIAEEEREQASRPRRQPLLGRVWAYIKLHWFGIGWADDDEEGR